MDDENLDSEIPSAERQSFLRLTRELASLPLEQSAAALERLSACRLWTRCYCRSLEHRGTGPIAPVSGRPRERRARPTKRRQAVPADAQVRPRQRSSRQGLQPMHSQSTSLGAEETPGASFSPRVSGASATRVSVLELLLQVFQCCTEAATHPLKIESIVPDI